MARLIVSPQANADLIAIADWIMRDNPSAAERWVDAISQVFELLASHPLSGERCHTIKRRPLRRYVLGNYVIYYQAHLDGVDIIRVIHAARQHEQIVNEEID